jgi:cytochrome P450
MGFLPSIVARSAYLARKKVHQVLRPYYEHKHDQGPDVSDLVKQRGALFRQWDTNVDQLSKNEISVMLAATTNTIPTMFWYFAHVWTRPGLVAELRAEVSQYLGLPSSSSTKPPLGTSSMTIPFSKLDASCPLLGSCYREAVRLSSQILTLRKVASDITITSPDEGGRTYLLKAGNDVMIPAKVVHRKASTWGEDVEGFNPYRFLPDPTGNKEVDRLRKISFVPFGGGKHYCPGRHFAFAENMAVMTALLLGFELEGLDGDRLKMENSKMGQAAKPLPGWHGGPCVIRRREGWEHVEWRFAK